MIASTENCPTRTVWVEYAPGCFRCECCGMSQSESQLVDIHHTISSEGRGQ